MQQVRFEVQKRTAFGKGAMRALRRAGQIPAILYGRHKEVIPLQVNTRMLQRFLKSYGENVLIDLAVASHGVETVLIKGIQRDAVNYDLLHADFIRISLEDPVTSPAPVFLVGSAPGVSRGGVLEFPHRQLILHCLPTLLPDKVEVDVSRLDLNDSIRVADLSLAEGIKVLDDPHTTIALISPPKVTETKATTEAPAAAAPAKAEPAVVSRKRNEGKK